MALLDQIQAEILSLKELESGDTWTANFYVLISLDDLAVEVHLSHSKQSELKQSQRSIEHDFFIQFLLIFY